MVSWPLHRIMIGSEDVGSWSEVSPGGIFSQKIAAVTPWLQMTELMIPIWTNRIGGVDIWTIDQCRSVIERGVVGLRSGQFAHS